MSDFFLKFQRRPTDSVGISERNRTVSMLTWKGQSERRMLNGKELGHLLKLRNWGRKVQKQDMSLLYMIYPIVAVPLMYKRTWSCQHAAFAYKSNKIRQSCDIIRHSDVCVLTDKPACGYCHRFQGGTKRGKAVLHIPWYICTVLRARMDNRFDFG